MLRDTAILFATAPLLAAAVGGDVRSVVGSCADGSVVFATKWEDVHCEGAIRVPAGHVPKVGSVWDRSAAESWQREATREMSLEAEIAAAVVRPLPPPPDHSPVTLSAQEVRDLKRFLSLGQAPAAARIEYRRGAGSPDRMTVAQLGSMAERLHRAFERRRTPLPGPVLVFHLEASLATPSLPVPSFAQGGVGFRPEPDDVSQFGWLAERTWGSAVGYIALPASFDPTRPMAIFWGDAVVATRPFQER